ncbi:MAG: DUF116 domain-containing protein [Syntrophales bacterium]|nr:DUF116 domain-containing protein [Syntrophales bacterium]MDD5641497.1 DUF116 domain-containing protein [Syntrophales bacterium]
MDDSPKILDGGNSLRPQKRIFLGLLVVTCVLFAVILAVLWYVPYVGLTTLHPKMPLILGTSFLVLLFLVLGVVAMLAFTVMLGRDLFFSKKLRGVVIKLLLPLMSGVGKICGVSKDQVQRSFIAINNQLVLAQHLKATPDKLLLLMPHCLQFHECKFRITGNIVHCQRCGKCPIKGLAELSDRYGVGIAVATGGTLARRIVVERRPKLIIAVACERDLSSGIQDSYPLPVYGIINHRPHGPCYDTLVNLERVEEALQTFLVPGAVADLPVKDDSPGEEA